MGLSSDVISQFVRATNDSKPKKTESSSYGTVVEYNGSTFVQLDGSNILTPITTTAAVKSGERVRVAIKNHTATVTGNVSHPAARDQDVKDLDEKVDEEIKDVSNQISEFEIVIADKVSTSEFDAEKARIDELTAMDVTIRNTLDAHKATIDDLVADDVVINETLTANKALIDSLSTSKLDASVADLTYATIGDLDATNVTVTNLNSSYATFVETTTDRFTANEALINALNTNKLSATDADLKYANIDFANIGEAAIRNFYSKSGLIDDLVIENGAVTGELVGVRINGDLITAGTLVADKLMLLGADGLYYRLNTDGDTVEGSQTDYNSINGKVIAAQSITANKINVSDLSAFEATIGGFHLTDTAIYSGVKNSVKNTTAGIYMDSLGQLEIGDSTNYIRYYIDGTSKKLEISGGSVVIGSGTASDAINKLIEDTERIDSQTGYNSDNIYDLSNRVDTNDAAISDLEDRTSANEGSIVNLDDRTATNESDVQYAIGQTESNSSYISELETRTTVNEGNISDIGDRTAINESDIVNLDDRTTINENDITYLDGRAEENYNSSVENSNKIKDVETAIAVLKDSLKFIVTSSDGSSVMTQTENGWTFNVTDIEDRLSQTSNNLNDLTNKVGDTDHTVEVLQDAVDDLGVIGEYVKIGVYEDEPCIELGESDSNFKVLITNTRIMFQEGSATPTYISNQTLITKKVRVEEELRQGNNEGDFVWSVRENGNYGLSWVGAEVVEEEKYTNIAKNGTWVLNKRYNSSFQLVDAPGYAIFKSEDVTGKLTTDPTIARIRFSTNVNLLATTAKEVWWLSTGQVPSYQNTMYKGAENVTKDANGDWMYKVGYISSYNNFTDYARNADYSKVTNVGFVLQIDTSGASITTANLPSVIMTLNEEILD